MYPIKRCSAVAALALLALSSTVKAQVTGFGTNGTGWSLNAQSYSPFAPAVAADDLHLTSGFSNATSAFNNTAQDVTAFTASFTFTNNTPYNGFDPGDGFTFALQNAGPTAVGSGGGYLGYAGIGSATGLAFNLWAPGGSGIGLANSSIPYNYSSTGSVNLDLTDPMKVNLGYSAGTLSVSILDTVTLNTYATSYAVNIPTLVGGNTAYVGFTGGTGGAQMDLHITDFKYSSASVPDGGSTCAFLGLALCGLAAMRRKLRA